MQNDSTRLRQTYFYNIETQIDPYSTIRFQLIPRVDIFNCNIYIIILKKFFQ